MAAIADDGTWLLADIKGRDSFAENVEKNPMASMMYGISIMSCLSSALSEPGGAGLGALEQPPAAATDPTAATPAPDPTAVAPESADPAGAA